MIASLYNHTSYEILHSQTAKNILQKYRKKVLNSKKQQQRINRAFRSEIFLLDFLSKNFDRSED